MFTHSDALRITDLVYQPLAHACAELEKAGYRKTKPISTVLGSQAICCLKGDRAYVVFRGTSSLIDLLIDLLCLPTLFTWRAPRHLGFWLAWVVQLRAGVRRWLDKTPIPAAGVVYCGHSLGGALAQLAGFDFAPRYRTAWILTFGSPRVFWGWGAAAYDRAPTLGCDNASSALGARTKRYVYAADVVPRLPFVLTGYLHTGQCVPVGDDPAWVKSLAAGLWGGDAHPGLPPHPARPVVSPSGTIDWAAAREKLGWLKALADANPLLKSLLLIVFLFLYGWLRLALSLLRHPRNNYADLMLPTSAEQFTPYVPNSPREWAWHLLSFRWLWSLLLLAAGLAGLWAFGYSAWLLGRWLVTSINWV